MPKRRKTPVVYVQEIVKFPPSIAQVETAIPAFIGYTEFAKKDLDNDLLNKPHRISSMLEYEEYFGLPKKESNLNIVISDGKITVNGPNETQKSPFLMHYSLQLYFANGGGDCYIVCAGQYGENQTNTVSSVALLGLENALLELEKENEPTLIVFPDGTQLPTDTDYYSIINTALMQCHKLGDRFVIMDTFRDKTYDNKDPIESFRNGIILSTEYLKNGAAYFPFLETIMDYQYDEDLVLVEKTGLDPISLTDLKSSDVVLYNNIMIEISKVPIILPPSSAMAGIYSRVDSNKGVWKAPANVGINNVIKPTVHISNEDQEDLNNDTLAGKSINAIRAFTGKGTLVWGARTLAGNDNEWRYVPVRRFFLMLEESISKSLEPFVFELNNQNTWVRAKAMIQNFLTSQWKNGALAGSTPRDAFFVNVGLGETMTAQDLLEGKMIVEIGMAAVRPAEFIVLRFSQKMLEA